MLLRPVCPSSFANLQPTEWVVCKSLLHEQWKLIDNLLIGMREPLVVMSSEIIGQCTNKNGDGQWWSKSCPRSVGHSLTRWVCRWFSQSVRSRTRSRRPGTWLDSLTPSPGAGNLPVCVCLVYLMNSESKSDSLWLILTEVLRWRFVSHRSFNVSLQQRDRINCDGQTEREWEREKTRSWNASELILDFTFD